AAARVRLITAPLAAADAAPYGDGRKEAIDDVEIIEPPPTMRIGSTACLMPRKTARSKTAMVLSHSSALRASRTNGARRDSIFEHDITPPVFAACPLNERLDVLFVRHIGMVKDRTSASCGDFTDYLFAALGIQIRDHYGRAFPGQAQRSTSADPA